MKRRHNNKKKIPNKIRRVEHYLIMAQFLVSGRGMGEKDSDAPKANIEYDLNRHHMLCVKADDIDLTLSKNVVCRNCAVGKMLCAFVQCIRIELPLIACHASCQCTHIYDAIHFQREFLLFGFSVRCWNQALSREKPANNIVYQPFVFFLFISKHNDCN